MPSRRDIQDHVGALRAVVEERISGHWRLDDERWRAHDALHVELRDSLREYKVSSNEWRQTLNDLSARMLTRTEYEAKHGALEALLASSSAALDAKTVAVNERLTEKIEPLKDARISTDVERRTTRSIFTDIRVTILAAATIIGILIGVANYFVAHP